MDITVTNYTEMIAFWLIFSRLMAIFMQIPLFDNVAVPVMVKTLFTVVTSYMFYPLVKDSVISDIVYFGSNSFWLLTGYYTLIGLVIGFLVKSIMSLYLSAGNLITQQIGFGAIRYFDQSAGEQIGPFEQLIQWAILVMIISTGALIPMFKGALTSFHSITAQNMGHLDQLTPFYIELFKSIFLSSLMLASPLIFTNILITVVLGVISRMVPQMNVLMVSFVVNIGVGLLVFSSVSGEFFQVGYGLYVEKLGEWFQFIS